MVSDFYNTIIVGKIIFDEGITAKCIEIFLQRGFRQQCQACDDHMIMQQRMWKETSSYIVTPSSANN